MTDRSTAAPWELTKADMREARRCNAPDCAQEATTRTRDEAGEIRYRCDSCAAVRLGVRVDTLERAHGQWNGGTVT